MGMNVWKVRLVLAGFVVFGKRFGKCVFVLHWHLDLQ